MVVAGQWRFAGMGGAVMGLDYAACRAGLKMAGVHVTPEIFAGLRVMERAALDVLSAR